MENGVNVFLKVISNIDEPHRPILHLQFWYGFYFNKIYSIQKPEPGPTAHNSFLFVMDPIVGTWQLKMLSFLF